MRKQKTRKLLLFLVIVTEIVLLNISQVQAISIPSATSVMKDIENRYHLSPESLQDFGEFFNVAGTKSSAPEVMLFFTPSDPKPGEKLTARAMPLNFSNLKESLYYTWYLKHEGCNDDPDKELDPDNSQDKTKLDSCNRDDDRYITFNDWKVEAMRKITNNGYDTNKADWSNPDDDNDGYDANWGGDNREDMPEYCYVHDFETGEDYELNDAISESTAICTSGTAACVEDTTLACPGTLAGGAGDIFTDYTVCEEVGIPVCTSISGTVRVRCDNGVPRCVTGSLPSYDCDSSAAVLSNASCSQSSRITGTPTRCTDSADVGPGNNLCAHLFPEYKRGAVSNEEVGNGDFKEDEEKFWRTDPHDPDTADNGNKDEANAVGLGTDSFTWNYQPGDKVGVVVEGVSTTPTKHEDSSMMVMWALPNNDCPLTAGSDEDCDVKSETGYYYKPIKGYDVKIPTTDLNLNCCLEDNLVDPREGGQPKKMEVELSYSPDNPINDPSEEESGDVLVVNAITSNASQEISQQLYDWSVEISDNPFDEDGWTGITSDLFDDDLILNPVKGNGLTTFKLKLGLGSKFKDYFKDGTGYLRIKVTVSESFSAYDETYREGKSDVIVMITSTEEKIMSYPVEISETNGKVQLDISRSLCKTEDNKEKAVCPLVKNEIVGVKIDNSGNKYKNFSWTLNGDPLICDYSVSTTCNDSNQIWVNFFPVTGNIGDTYTLNLTANDVETGKNISLSRTYQIVDPYVLIKSDDKGSCWPKFLGEYQDLAGITYEDLSENIFQTYSGEQVSLKTDFHPSHLESLIKANPDLTWEWTVDGEEAGEKEDIMSLSIDKEGGSVYDVSLQAIYNQPTDVRKALKDIWGIYQFDTTEDYLSTSVQIEVLSYDEVASLTKHPVKFMAGLASHLPSQFTFLLRILLTIFTIILTTAIVFAFFPDPYKPKESTYE